mmetsp:Transcript_58871/g.175154  ORF Transcript_58871/g.175154 Transcript_58871/m.175154 type:complete len:220 (+) Transcript_58871:347-1006(+)
MAPTRTTRMMMARWSSPPSLAVPSLLTAEVKTKTTMGVGQSPLPREVPLRKRRKRARPRWEVIKTSLLHRRSTIAKSTKISRTRTRAETWHLGRTKSERAGKTRTREPRDLRCRQIAGSPERRRRTPPLRTIISLIWSIHSMVRASRRVPSKSSRRKKIHSAAGVSTNILPPLAAAEGRTAAAIVIAKCRTMGRLRVNIRTTGQRQGRKSGPPTSISPS